MVEDQGIIHWLVASTAYVMAFVLIMIVMRGLLANVWAIADHTELDEVILMAIIVDLDVMLARRKMSVGDFAEAVGITPANVALL